MQYDEDWFRSAMVGPPR